LVCCRETGWTLRSRAWVASDPIVGDAETATQWRHGDQGYAGLFDLPTALAFFAPPSFGLTGLDPGAAPA